MESILLLVSSHPTCVPTHTYVISPLSFSYLTMILTGLYYPRVEYQIPLHTQTGYYPLILSYIGNTTSTHFFWNFFGIFFFRSGISFFFGGGVGKAQHLKKFTDAMQFLASQPPLASMSSIPTRNHIPSGKKCLQHIEYTIFEALRYNNPFCKILWWNPLIIYGFSISYGLNHFRTTDQMTSRFT